MIKHDVASRSEWTRNKLHLQKRTTVPINRRKEVENRVVGLSVSLLSCAFIAQSKKKKKKPKSGIARAHLGAQWKYTQTKKKKKRIFFWGQQKEEKPVFFFFFCCCLKMLLAVIRPWLVGRWIFFFLVVGSFFHDLVRNVCTTPRARPRPQLFFSVFFFFSLSTTGKYNNNNDTQARELKSRHFLLWPCQLTFGFFISSTGFLGFFWFLFGIEPTVVS